MHLLLAPANANFRNRLPHNGGSDRFPAKERIYGYKTIDILLHIGIIIRPGRLDNKTGYAARHADKLSCLQEARINGRIEQQHHFKRYTGP
ncbi:hypothetical protein D3C78_1336650 [compost metagenome]